MSTIIPACVLFATALTGAEQATGQPFAMPPAVRTTVPENRPKTTPPPLERNRGAAAKYLGVARLRGRRMTEDQSSAREKHARAQGKSDREWEPRLRRWKSWLKSRARHGEAEIALAGVTDPRAVPAIWKVFATGRATDQRTAVQLLGQLQGALASRGLALLAVSGESAEVRRVATETLRRRDPMEFADVLIDLIREPVEYEVRPVAGPGRPGSLTVKDRLFNVERIYAPPPPPELPVFPDDALRLDARGMPILVRHTDTAGLPFAWVDDSGNTYPSRCVIPPHVPVVIQLGAMWLENWKSARSAQGQLLGDVAAVERVNDLRHAANERVVDVLIQATGERLPVDRTSWCIWWFRKSGRTYTADTEPRRPTVTHVVPLDYLPHNVTGLGFDPAAGYYIRASTFGR